MKMRIELQDKNFVITATNLNVPDQDVFHSKMPDIFVYNEAYYKLDSVILSTNKWGSHVVYKKCETPAYFEEWEGWFTADPNDPNYF